MKTATKTFDEKRKMFWNECQRIADMVFAAYCRCIEQKLYLVGQKRPTPDGFIWERFALITEYDKCTDTGDNWELVFTYHIPRNISDEQLPYWIQDKLRREPIWIYAD